MDYDYYDYNFGNSSGGSGFGGGNDADLWELIGIDPNTISYTWDSPTNEEIMKQIGYEDPSVLSQIANLLKSAGTSAVQKLASTFTTGGKTDWKKVAGVAGGLYGLYQSNQPQPQTGYQGKIPKYEAIRAEVPGTNDPNRRPGSSGQRYFSDVKFAKPGEETAARAAATEEAAGLAALNRGNPAREEVPTYAHGGVTTLARGGQPPRYLAGASDGMADKIPARIDDKQEARLSHGEFVVPADVVSHLGNGNSDAGAQRLYDMMDRIRKARTGTAKQGKQVNPNKFMPV
jgi:hypothetical protein